MRHQQVTQWQQIAWKSATAAAITILLVSIYFAVILPLFGFSFDMLDNEAASIAWRIDNNTAGLYQGMFILYFISQLVVLPLPFALHKITANPMNNVYSACFALVGTAGVLLALASPIFLYANIPEVMRTANAGVVPMESIVFISNLLADLTKDFRLFSEILIGIWLISFGFSIRKHVAGKIKSTLIGFLGFLIFLIPSWKLVDPFMALEDYIALILFVSFIMLAIITYNMKRIPKPISL